MTISRRTLITGLVSFIAAPAIVKVSSIMPVKAIEPDFELSGTYIKMLLNQRYGKFSDRSADALMFGVRYWITNPDGTMKFIDPREIYIDERSKARA